MKKPLIYFVLLAVLLLAGCKSGKKSEEIRNYTYQENSVPVNSKIQNKVGDWVTEGTVCYGLIVLVDTHGKIQRGLPIKSKVVLINSDSLKMKAMENVSLAAIKGCKKMGLSRGDYWWENEGELFKTKGEAEAYLKKKGWLK
jgi:hypothetical protein